MMMALYRARRAARAASYRRGLYAHQQKTCQNSLRELEITTLPVLPTTIVLPATAPPALPHHLHWTNLLRTTHETLTLPLLSRHPETWRRGLNRSPENVHRRLMPQAAKYLHLHPRMVLVQWVCQTVPSSHRSALLRLRHRELHQACIRVLSATIRARRRRIPMLLQGLLIPKLCRMPCLRTL